MASLKEGICIAVVPLNDCDILCIDQLSGKRDQYRRQLITEAAMGRQHACIVTYTQLGRATFIDNTLIQRPQQSCRKKHTLTSMLTDKQTENSNSF